LAEALLLCAAIITSGGIKSTTRLLTQARITKTG
jgi:hypothetical protein